MMKCGLLGRHLAHSYSPQIHAMLGDYSYELFEREPDEIEDFLKSGCWDGLNVTVPYKKTVIPFLDELTPIAQRLGAVNTIIRRNGRLIGHNTDYFGFQTLMKSLSTPIGGEKAFILGSGGASNTAAAVLKDAGAQVVVISRNGENNYNNLHLHKDARLIVNTTPVGMYPNTGISPVDLTNRNSFPCLQAVVDVIYNPARTKLLLDSETNEHIECANGLLMLAAQAKEAAEWFTGRKIPNEIIGNITRTLEVQMQNIVLVGMPSCGKSAVGKNLAARMGRKFVDTDEEFVRRFGITPCDYIIKYGEKGFRDTESMVVAECAAESGNVIATGGGAILRDENVRALSRNGRIYFIDRSLSYLEPSDDRPLSSDKTSLEKLYSERYERYKGVSDVTVDGDGSISEVAESVYKEFVHTHNK